VLVDAVYVAAFASLLLSRFSIRLRSFFFVIFAVAFEFVNLDQKIMIRSLV